ncbi:MAG: hypothetical protein JWO58_1608 [Chitinophagaceae bacterium]|nr:hypothetical protein [Chitinophagaceae bacterium]
MKTDAEIQKDVMEELKWQPFLKASEIGVAVKNGVVTLTGTVDMYSKKISAENAAKKIAGVKAVAEDIIVQLSTSTQRTDTEIAEAVVNALRWNSMVPDRNIKVKVEKHWVTLEGEVEWNYQKLAAYNSVFNLLGVIGVTNTIKVKSAVDMKDVKQKISNVFLRHAALDADKITISVEGNRVTLTGKVRSFIEKKDAESACWQAPGVNIVDNKIEIDPKVYAY